MSEVLGIKTIKPSSYYSQPLARKGANLVPRVFSFFNMAAAGVLLLENEETLVTGLLFLVT